MNLYHHLILSQKSKTKILPTEIIVTNLLNPSLKLSNKIIDLNIRNLNKYEGYISIGKNFLKNLLVLIESLDLIYI